MKRITNTAVKRDFLSCRWNNANSILDARYSILVPHNPTSNEDRVSPLLKHAASITTGSLLEYLDRFLQQLLVKKEKQA